MFRINFQYFLCFAVIGSLLPIFTVFLSDKGLTESQIGVVMAMTSLAAIITPVMVGFLADAKVDPRRLMMMVFLFSAIPLLALYYSGTLFWIFLFTAVHYLALAPITSLQDGMNFSMQRAREKEGLPQVPYNKIRIWGSVGFIFPSVILYFLMRWGMTTSAVLFVAVFFCGLGVYNAWRMPDSCGRITPPPSTTDGANAGPRFPTFAALAMLKQRDVLVLFVAMSLVHIAAAGYYTYYPIYLKKVVGIDARWIGLIAQIGVIIEVGVMLLYAPLIRWMGIRRLLALGVFGLAVRMVLLAYFVSPAVAIGTQVFHGINVLVFHVLPQVYLNQRAGDHYRNSMQAVFTMSVSGVSRIVGNLAMGALAQVSLSLAFYAGAGLSAVAAGLLFWLFVEHKPGEEKT